MKCHEFAWFEENKIYNYFLQIFELRLFLGGFTEQLRKLQEEVDNKKAELARRMAQRDQFFTPPPTALMGGAITTPPPSFREQPLGENVFLKLVPKCFD